MPHSEDTDEKLKTYRKEICKQIKIARKMKKMSQTEFGNISDISLQQFQKYEKGKNRISAELLAHLSDVLDMPVEHFFRTCNVNADIETVVDADAIKFLNHFSSLTDERKKTALAIIRILKKGDK